MSTLTPNAIKESIRNAKIELKQLENSPMQIGFSGVRSNLKHFIHHMEKELHHAN